ncbi:MAG: hypothetical protein AB7S26_09620 [Sandaracinaceae bacterium]
MKGSRHILFVLAGLVSYLPAALCLAFIHHHAVNLPCGDEWDGTVPMLLRFADGEMPWREIWQLDNEHRLVLPHLVQLALAILTRYDNRAELYVGWGCLVAISAVFLRELLRQRSFAPETLLLMLPVNVAIFTLRQAENLILAYQINVMMSVALALGSFAWLARPTPLRVGVALGLGVASLYSHALGLAVLPIGALLLALHVWASRDRRLAFALAGWGVVTAAALVAYFHGYEAPSYHPDPLRAVVHPARAAQFFFAALGTAWSVDATGAIGVGALLAAGYARALFGPPHADDRTLVRGAILLSIACAVLVALGRSGFEDLRMAIPHRYATYATPGMAALFLYAVGRPRRDEVARHIAAAWCVLLAVLTPLASVDAMSYAETASAERRALSRAMSAHAGVTLERLEAIKPWMPLTILERAPHLERIGWSVYRDRPMRPALASVATDRYSIDVIDGAEVAPRAPVRIDRAHGAIPIEGWALDPRLDAPASRLFVRVGGVRVVAQTGLTRNDVARSAGDPRLTASGFRALVPAAELGRGVHAVCLELPARDGDRGLLIATSAMLEVP